MISVHVAVGSKTKICGLSRVILNAHAYLEVAPSAQVITTSRVGMALTGFSLKKDRYVALLEKLIGETEFLQDNPPKFVPQEDK